MLWLALEDLLSLRLRLAETLDDVVSEEDNDDVEDCEEDSVELSVTVRDGVGTREGVPVSEAELLGVDEAVSEEDNDDDEDCDTLLLVVTDGESLAEAVRLVELEVEALAVVVGVTLALCELLCDAEEETDAESLADGLEEALSDSVKEAVGVGSRDAVGVDVEESLEDSVSDVLSLVDTLALLEKVSLLVAVGDEVGDVEALGVDEELALGLEVLDSDLDVVREVLLLAVGVTVSVSEEDIVAEELCLLLCDVFFDVVELGLLLSLELGELEALLLSVTLAVELVVCGALSVALAEDDADEVGVALGEELCDGELLKLSEPVAVSGWLVDAVDDAVSLFVADGDDVGLLLSEALSVSDDEKLAVSDADNELDWLRDALALLLSLCVAETLLLAVPVSGSL